MLSALAIDPNDANIVVAGADYARIFRSHDAGVTWERDRVGQGSQIINGLELGFGADGGAVAATSNGVWFTIALDSGNWDVDKVLDGRRLGAVGLPPCACAGRRSADAERAVCRHELRPVQDHDVQWLRRCPGLAAGGDRTERAGPPRRLGFFCNGHAVHCNRSGHPQADRRRRHGGPEQQHWPASADGHCTGGRSADRQLALRRPVDAGHIQGQPGDGGLAVLQSRPQHPRHQGAGGELAGPSAPLCGHQRWRHFRHPPEVNRP